MKVFIARRNETTCYAKEEDKIYSTLEAAIFNLAIASGYQNYSIKRTGVQQEVYGAAAEQKIEEYRSRTIELFCYDSTASNTEKAYLITEHEVITGDDAYTSPPAI